VTDFAADLLTVDPLCHPGQRVGAHLAAEVRAAAGGLVAAARGQRGTGEGDDRESNAQHAGTMGARA
jgi:hypothetical protein